MTFLGIDVGTSFIKGAVLDLERLALGEPQRVPFPQRIAGQPALFHEVDPGAILAATRQLIGRLLPQAPNCAGMVVSGQMGGLMLGTHQGEPLANYISWQDQRLMLPHPSGAGTFYEVMRQRLTEADRKQLGREVRPGLPVSYLFWLAESQRLSPGPAVAYNLPDWVITQLCGCPPATHFTQAVGALNLETRDWHQAVFAKLGLAPIRWPALHEITEPIGAMKLGSQSLPCYPAVGDHQCALAGAFLGFEELSLNISTGSQASLLTPQWEPGNYQTRPFFEGRFLNTITHLPAGRSLNLLVGLLTELAAAQQIQIDDPWSYIAQEVEKVNETDLSAQLTFFPGPLGESGAIANIRESNLTVGHLFRAAFENMVECYFTSAARLSPNRAWRNLVFSGGLALRFGLLRELIRQKFQSDYRVCSSPEDALQGLLALALVVSGKASSLEKAMQILRDHEESLPAKGSTE